MKFKGKLLIAVILCIFSIVKLNSLKAVGNVYQAIADYGVDGKAQLVYRTVVRPSEATLGLFQSYNSWEKGEKIAESSWSTYRTKYLIFTQNMIGKYTENSTTKVNVGYATFSVNQEGYEAFLSSDPKDVKTWYNNASQKHVEYVEVTDNFGSYFYKYRYTDATTSKITDQNLSEAAFKKYNENTIETVGKEITLSPLFNAESPEIISGAKYVKPLSNKYSIKGVIDWKTYRQMLYTEESFKSSSPDGENHNTEKIFYISDILLDSTTTSQLIDYYNEKNKDPYVSAIASTKSKKYGEEFYTLTPGAFIHSKLRGLGDGTGWSRATLGIRNNGMSSGLNLWDNILKLPDVTDTTKKVLVNHIAVDVDAYGNRKYSLMSTSEETFTIGNSKNDLREVGNVYIASDGTLTTNNTNGTLKKVLVSKEVLESKGIQYILRASKSTPVIKINKLKNISTDYVYAGHTVDLLKKADTITDAYYGSKYNVKSSGEPTITLANNINELVINMYYEAKAKEVTVQYNVCRDFVNFSDCVTIEGNRQLVLTYGNATSVMRWLEPENIETYSVNEKYDISASKVESPNYEYKGYIVEYGDTKSNLTNANTCKVKAQDSQSSDIKINFYYSRKGESSIIVKEKPTIDIPGTLTIQSAVDVSTTCEEYYSVPTNAKNNTSDVYVGIKNTPVYVLAGIDVEQQKEEDRKVTINVTMNFGPNSKVWKIEVPYSYSYYAIKDLLIYKYQKAEIYNAGSANTSGDTLFAQNTLNITPKSTLNSNLKLYTFINSNMLFTDNMNWKNYLTIKYSLNSKINNAYNSSAEARNEIENAYARTLSNNNIVNIISNVPGEEVLELKHEFVSNPIGSYMTYKINDVEVLVNDNLEKAYADITSTGTASIEIELLSEEIYNKIDTNADGEIDLLDLADAIDNTDAQITRTRTTESGYSNSYQGYIAAESEYFSACEGYGYEYGDCLDECEHSEHYEVLRNLQSTYKSKLSDAKMGMGAYRRQIATLKDLYKIEMYAVQHFDEALAIKRMWYNDVTAAFYGTTEVYANKGLVDYTSEELAQLLGLNIKFDYSSGNAKLGNTELMNVKTHTLELKSNATHALNGELVGDICTPQNIVASRPTMNATQKQYYTSGIAGTSWLPNERRAASSTYYNNNAYTIPITRLNGTRVLAGKAYYAIDSTNRVGTSTAVKDNMYYDIEVSSNQKVTEKVFEVSSSSTFVKNYGVTQNTEVAQKQKTNAKYNSGNVNSEEFNVYTPLVVTATLEQEADIIDQANIAGNGGLDTIQSNSAFTIRFSNNKDNVYANNSNKPNDFTTRYKQVTYIKFDFAVSGIKYIGSNGYVGTYGSAAANEWIGPIYGDYITAVPFINTTEGENKKDKSYNYYVIAAAINTQDSWTKQLLAYINTSLNDLENANLVSIFKNACGYEGKNKLSYYADFQGKMMILNRIYDFRVTDLKDIDWKEVFRTNTSNSYVNQHSQIAYYSGLSKWNTNNSSTNNQIVGRTPDEIGTSPTRILPLGPYKNTNTLYISAPKMGYRFSFDLKVTGAMDNNKYVEINPSFYYISKDGKTFYTEYSSGNEGIYLFYKNSDGKYVRIGSSSDTYKIQFTPNDGYRSLVQTSVNNLSSNAVTLGSLRKLVLKLTETTTASQDDAAITYYGEYKLPNSTIAVRVDKNGVYDINNPLSSGYIGVVFDIRAYESSDLSLVYGKNSYKGKTNTSQWDYEGYLGISKPGENYSTTLKLEKGTWNIDNTTYNKIKGTVILYDADSRASNDFN